jgi:hypothetical protein
MIIIFFSIAHLSFAEYSIVQITDNEIDDYVTMINNSGMITWYGNDGNGNEIFLYDGTTIIQITDNNQNDRFPQINNSGEIVWQEIYTPPEEGPQVDDYRIYLYDGTNIIQLAGSDLDNLWPQINNRGEIIWLSEGGARYDIIFYDRVTKTTIAGPECRSPDLNDMGEVAYECLNAIFVWSATGRIQITELELTEDERPRISNNGNVVWLRFDGNDFEIFFYDGTGTSQLTDNGFDDEYHQINDHGNIVWSGDAGGDWEIFYYDGTNITQITDNDFDDTRPQINSRNKIVWESYDGNDYEIFIYNGVTITQLTDNDFDDRAPQVNDVGQVAWSGRNDAEIFLATPVDDDDDGGGGGSSGGT